MVPEKARTWFFLLSLIPAAASAQAFPEAALQVGLGISAFEGRGAIGGMAALSRSWGPFFGAVGGEMRVITGPVKGSPGTGYDPYLGKTCGTGGTQTRTSNCSTSYGSEGAATAEIGVLFAPYSPLMLSVGARAGSISEKFIAASVFGSTKKEGISWMGRVAAGKKVVTINFGVVLEIGAGR
jgi:hypothetical protein